MSNEKKKTRAQFLNALAVAVLAGVASAVGGGSASPWTLLPAVVASIALHAIAVSIVE